MNINTVLLIVIIANVLFSLKGLNDYSFFEKYKFQIGGIKQGEKIRMLSSGFLHADYMHLGMNMYVLYIFGPAVIGQLGEIPFLIVYFGSLFIGNLLTLKYHGKELYYSAVGASGAVAGVIFSGILLHPDMRLTIFPIPISLPSYVFGIGYLLYSIVGMKKQLGNVGHSAHLGGAIGGYILTLILNPSVFSDNLNIVLLIGLPIVLLLIFGKKLEKL
ncbi:MAG: rhomboid family intramembrane serine protease [Flavobacteriaceae bacterium]|nr:MAG: rhomboid family intramembrane serine protease [Flavobacteriaceae bacterium]